MKAMLLAAGLGTRLRPLTDTIPKALVKVNDTTLLELAILHLKQNGVSDVIINVHHFAGQIMDFLMERNHFGLNINISDESDLLLDTGGGLKKAAWFFDDGEPFLVRNVDVISDLDFTLVETAHRQSGSLATLVVRDRATSRYLLFDHRQQLSGWENLRTGETRITRELTGDLERKAFSGMQILSPGIFPLITETGKFSLIDLYLRLSSSHPILGFNDRHSSWWDAGKIEDLKI